jgi:mRNA interferase MazF
MSKVKPEVKPEVKITLERGDVYWVSLDPTIGAEIQKIRPVVVVSINPLNRARKTFIGVPLSTSAPAIEHVNIVLTGGSVARCDQVRTLDKSRLKHKIGKINTADMRTLSVSLKRVMGLDA